MGLVEQGEARAFEVIFDRHADAAFSLAYKRSPATKVSGTARTLVGLKRGLP